MPLTHATIRILMTHLVNTTNRNRTGTSEVVDGSIPVVLKFNCVEISGTSQNGQINARRLGPMLIMSREHNRLEIAGMRTRKVAAGALSITAELHHVGTMAG